MMLWYYKKLIDKYDVISFDVFDTLIQRDVLTPTDVYRNIGEKKIGKELAERFRYERMFAEETARKEKNGEISLVDIYRCFNEQQSGYHLIEDEIDYEVEHCKRKNKGYDLLKYAIEQNKTVMLVSDMYLNSLDIRNILRKCLERDIDSVYISSEIGVKKDKGELFKKVMEFNELIPNKVLHFGDSFKADFCGAKAVGVNSVLILRRMLLVSKMKSLYIKFNYMRYKKKQRGI